jgi:hypothetical protein
MKEIEAPHNDWWKSKDKLDLGDFQLESGNEPNNPAHVAARLFEEAEEAENLSRQVKAGIKRLLAGRTEGGGQSLKQQLRSLFATMEMNLVSDTEPLKKREHNNSSIELPLGFFVDARLVEEAPVIRVELARYKAALREVESEFAAGETPGLIESHHAFLVPARSFVDGQVVQSFVDSQPNEEERKAAEELVADVLAVDFTTPVYSAARAGLIQFVPEKAGSASELRDALTARLRQAPQGDTAAHELLMNLTDTARDATFHRRQAGEYLAACARAAGTDSALVGWLQLASQRRQAVRDAQPSWFERGFVLEDRPRSRAFRVLFPEYRKPDRRPLRMNPTTGQAEAVP